MLLGKCVFMWRSAASDAGGRSCCLTKYAGDDGNPVLPGAGVIVENAYGFSVPPVTLATSRGEAVSPNPCIPRPTAAAGIADSHAGIRKHALSGIESPLLPVLSA